MICPRTNGLCDCITAVGGCAAAPGVFHSKPVDLGETQKSEVVWIKTEAQDVIESREGSHGDYGKQASMAQALKKILRQGHTLTATQAESVDMICVKLSRIANGNPNEPDHWTDIAGYATLVSNLLTKGTHL